MFILSASMEDCRLIKQLLHSLVDLVELNARLEGYRKPK